VGSSCRRVWLAVLLAVMVSAAAGCGHRAGSGAGTSTTGTAVPPASQVETTAVVAMEAPGDALRFYLHGWMLRYDSKALGEPSTASGDATWTLEKPDDVVSVVPGGSLTDFKTAVAWSARIKPLAAPTATRAAYRVEFDFWRGSPLSSAGSGARPFTSSAAYDLVRDEARHAWVITLTSDPPGTHLVPSAHWGSQSP